MKAFPSFSLIFIATLVKLYLVNGKRNNVIIKGPSGLPSFIRKSGKLLNTCPPEFPYAFGHGKSCCSVAKRISDSNFCPRDPNRSHDILIIYDALGCCQSSLSLACPHETSLCKPSATDLQECPLSHPYAVENGLSCCQFPLRSASCPSGFCQPLEPTDALSCCMKASWIACTNPLTGQQGRCLSNGKRKHPIDGLFQPKGAKCIFHSDDQVIYDAAVTICQSRESILVEIKSQAEYDAVRPALTGHISYWIGINDIGHEGSWEYSSDGSGPAFTLWGHSSPDDCCNDQIEQEQNCVSLSVGHGHLYDDAFCTDVRGYICELV